MRVLPKSTGETQGKSARGRNYLSSPTERFRAVNSGNMLLAIIGGLNAIRWPVNGFGGRNFILTIYALCNGRERVIATSERVAEFLGKGDQSPRVQKSLITRHHQGLNKWAAKLGRAPITVDPGRRLGEATTYDCRALTAFALAVLAKYDVLKAQSRQLPQGKLNARSAPVEKRSLEGANSARSELVNQNATSAVFAPPREPKTKFNPTEAILSCVAAALVYIPVSGKNSATPPTLLQDQDQTPPLPAKKSATHLGKRISLPSVVFARKTQSDEFRFWHGQKLQRIIEKAQRGERILSIWWPKAVGVCACGKSDCKAPRVAKHPVGMRNGVSDASTDIEWIKDQFTRYPFAGVGVATTDRLVVDVDFRTNGHYSLRSLIHDYEPLPDTYRIRTGQGRSYHFEKPYATIRSSSSKLAPGIDIKTGKNYVIVEGTHWTGREYRVENNAPLALLPLWLLDLLIDPSDMPVRESGVSVPVGARNHFLFMEALRLARTRFAHERDIYSELTRIYEAECEHGPPVVPPDEIGRIAASAFRIAGSARREGVA
jgi:Bifunctional DNA primase/polymerase, N-terminal